MYENLQEAFMHKKFVPIPRPFASSKLHDQYAVEPWEKNTLQIDMRDDPIRKAKTFYHSPNVSKHHRHYTTQKGFNFSKGQESRGLYKPKSLAEVSRKSAVSAYNISGNILGDAFTSQKSMPFQLPYKKNKTFRSREKTAPKKEDEIEPIPARQTVYAMKRRINRRKQQQTSAYVCLNVDNIEEMPQQSFLACKKRSKIISLGFQKISQMKELPRQRSMQLSVKGS